jgi:23S rRNA pseudouridine1911/1915/1917 synthase
LEAEVRQYLRPDNPGSVYLGTVHRLDRPVSGVVLWAKTPKAAHRLSQQFARRQAHKEYWALVAGQPASTEGVWEDWLIFDDATGRKRAQLCAPATPRAQAARARFRLEIAAQQPEGTSWLKLWPETGRTHQLRVQAAARGHPILGDLLYGSNAPFPEGIALHARSLTIIHPARAVPMTFTAPLPPSWTAAGFLPNPADRRGE